MVYNKAGQRCKSILLGLFNIIFPSSCVICDSILEILREKYICNQCFSQIKQVPLPVCIRCGKDLAESFKNISEPICVECKSEKLYFRYARAVGLYEGVLKESILLFKYKGKTGLGDKLAELMIRSLENIGWCNNIDIIVPVPLHKTRLKERGYNQAELLAIKIGKRFDIPVICNKLQRIKHTNVQTYLRKQDRIDNIKGAFQVNSGEIFCRKTLLLIDDVFTTGATVNECSRVLKQAGAKEIFVFTLARGR